MAESSSTVPAGDRASLEFTQQRAAVWAAAGTAIGLTTEDTAALTQPNTAAQDALDDRTAKAAEAKSSTISWHAAAATNRDLARDLVRKIRTFALQQTDPDAIYAAAQIPAPKTPGGLPEPAVPTDLSVTLDSQGRAVLKFESTRFGGTVWTIERRTVSTQGSISAWTLAGTSIEREFADEQTPSGVASVQYRVRAERPSGTSAFSTPVTLLFGAGGGNNNEVIASITPQGPIESQAG